MSETYSVKAVLSADISNFVSGITGASQALANLDKSSTPLKSIGQAAGIAGKALTKGVTLPLVGIGAASLKVGKEFEAGMSQVQAISGATGSDMERLKAMAREMGATTKFSATESAEAMTYMGMAGWKTQEMIDGLPGILNLAAASGEDLGAVSDIVTDSLTAFGMKASDTGRFVDVLAAAATNSNTNVSMMGETFKYAAPIAGALGYSVEDTALAVGLMANAGIKGSQAGTALRSALTRLEAPTAEVQKGMKMLGLDIQELQGMTLDQKLQTLRGAFDGLDESQKVQAASMLFGKQAMSGMLAILNASEEEYNSLKNAINDSAGAAEKMAKIMQDNLQGSITNLKSALEGVGIAIAENLGPKIRVVVDKLTELARAFNNLSPETQNFIINIGLVLAAIGPVLVIISKLIAGFMKLKGALTVIGGAFGFFKGVLVSVGTFIGTVVKGAVGLGQAFLALLGPVGVVIAIIAALIGVLVYLYNTNENVREFINAAWESIKETLITVWTAISEGAREIFEGLKEYFSTLWEGVSESFTVIWETIKETLTTLWQGIVESATDIWEGLKEFFTTLWEGIKETMVTTWEAIKEKAISTWEAIKTAIMGVIEPLVSSVKSSFDTLKTSLKSIWDNIKTIASTVWSAIKTVIFGLVAALLQAITGDWEGAKDTLRQIWDKIKGDAESIWNAIKTAIETAIKAAVDIAKSLMEGLKASVTSIWEAIKAKITSILENIKQTIQRKFNEAKTVATQAVENIKTAVSQGFERVLSTITQTMTQVPQRIRQGFTQAISDARSFIRQAVSVGKSIVQGFIRGINSMLSGIVNAAKNVVQRAINAAKAVAGIKSPSRVFMGMGKDLIAGGVIGIDRNASKMAKSSANAMEDTIKAFGDPKLEVGATMDKIRGSIGTQVDYSVKDNLSSKQPAYISFRLGDRDFRGFVEDITKVQGEEIRLQEVYG